MNNLYISHRSLNVPTYSFWAIGSMLISLFRVTYTVRNIAIRWTNFRKTSCMNMNYTYATTKFRSIFAQMYKFLVEKRYIYNFCSWMVEKICIYVFCLWTFQGQNENLKIIPEIHIFGQITSKYCRVSKNNFGISCGLLEWDLVVSLCRESFRCTIVQALILTPF